MEKVLLLKEDTIRSRVKELAGRISADYAGKKPVMIGILNGVVFFYVDLLKELTIPAKIDFVRAASYGPGTVSSGKIVLSKDVEIPIKDEDVILVEDIVDTGLTLNYILAKLKEKGPRSLRICALIDKPERRKEEVRVDYCGFKIKEGFLVGYGLDYNEEYRCLKDIYELRQG
ncbi:MAG: hypoxanthine phosphoribosyltransferase [Deltaproteobacteria bacterium]|nr:hypoxanthine phosphoribosyltransferase [Deltaproteobacteria bacterium]